VRWYEDDKRSNVDLRDEVIQHFLKNIIKLYFDLSRENN